MKKIFKKPGGFALLEIMVVFCLLAVLVVILIPIFQNAISRTKLADCISREKEISTIFHMYYIDYKKLPFQELPDLTIPLDKLSSYCPKDGIKCVCPETSLPFIYLVKLDQEGFTLMCRPQNSGLTSHSRQGLPPFYPKYTFESGLIKP